MQNFKLRFMVAAVLWGITITIAAQTHTVEKGDTLYNLSRKYEVSIADIMKANKISSPEALMPGTKLLIPGKKESSGIQNSQSSLYIVKKGDTFYRIARNHGLSVAQLMNFNDFGSDRILKPGESLFIPGQAESSSTVISDTTGQNKSPEAKTESHLLNTGLNKQTSWPVEGIKETLTGKLRGVKIEAAESSMVRSVASGTVVWTGPYREFGQVVLVDVNGYIYLYGGNEDVFVNVGEAVKPGARIGRLGNSGLASRTVDMYFSVFKEGVPVSVVSAPRG